jgi:hypothetical protein
VLSISQIHTHGKWQFARVSAKWLTWNVCFFWSCIRKAGYIQPTLISKISRNMPSQLPNIGLLNGNGSIMIGWRDLSDNKNVESWKTDGKTAN